MTETQILTLSSYKLSQVVKDIRVTPKLREASLAELIEIERQISLLSQSEDAVTADQDQIHFTGTQV